MENSKRSFSWIQTGGVILILLLASEVVLLTIQNRQLKKSLDQTTIGYQTDPLKPGERVEPVKIQLLDGTTKELSYQDPSRKYLLFVLSTTCPHCAKMLPVWKLIATHKAENCTVLGLCLHDLDQTTKFIAANNVGFYTASVAQDTSFGRKYKIGGIPETILIRGNGTVEKAWVGELTTNQADEISGLISTSTLSLN